MKIKYKCALCSAEYALPGFTNHIQRTHKIKYKDYYDKYINQSEHVCKFCGNPCAFSNSKGYYQTCNSDSCVRKQQRETMYNLYGKSCRHADKIKQKPVIEYKYTCVLCGNGYNSHATINRHIIKCHKEITTEEYALKYLNAKIEYCEICGERSKWMGTHYSNVCGRAECTHKLRVKNNAMNDPSKRRKISETQKAFSDERKNVIKQKRENALLEKTGYKHNWQNPECREKGLTTMLEKHGTKCGALTAKAKASIKEKYGVEHFSQSSEFAKKRRKKYVIGNLSFDSKDEIYFYSFVKACSFDIEVQPDIKLEYIYNDKKHVYQPDFKVNEKLYEIKGCQFFEDKDPTKRMVNPFDRSMDDLYEAKHQCMIANNVSVISDASLFSLLKLFFNIDLNENEIYRKCFGKKFPGTQKWEANHPIWDGFLPGHKSPKDAWHDEKLFRRAIQNLIKILNDSISENKYDSFCRKHIHALANIDKNDDLLTLILNRFTIAKIAPKVTALRSTDLLKIIEEANVDLSNGVYCPMAGFGGIVEGVKKWFTDRNEEPIIEAYDINENFCNWYGWTQRDVLAQKIKTDKVVIVCPPFGKQYEHWKGTPDEMSDIEFIKWVDLIKEHIEAPDYIFIGPEYNEGKNECGLFKRKIGIALWNDGKLKEWQNRVNI